ncbi:MAG: PQQ-binding-like beta-propeller repeat protein [Planctomycetes bacterium]|nr:PQQ-binding-like beta-propeller repeat protein [Planctomycetota bacterium]
MKLPLRVGLLLAATYACWTSAVCLAEDWPQWMGTKRDAVWRETGIIEKFPASGPKVLWRVPVHGGYAGPAVAEGRVYVTDLVTAADTKSVSNPMSRPEINGEERIVCFDAQTGREIWKHAYPCKYAISYPCGPRCTPTVHQGKVYALGAEGHLFCLDATKGTVLWSKDFKADFGAKTPVWGFCSHPLVDGQKLICVVGGKDAVAYAFDKDTGKVLWQALEASGPGYSPPTLIEAGGTRQLLIWHTQALNGLDPETGRVYWSVKLEPQFGMSIMAPRQLGDKLFAGGIGGVSVLLQLAADKPAVTELWRGSMKTGASPVNATPFLENGFMYAVDQPGTLMGVNLENGQRVWETFKPISEDPNARRISSGTAFLVKNGERFFLFAETGNLIIARLTPKGYDEISRTKLLEPTGMAFSDRDVVWSHPAFANKCVFARNDKELVCASLAAE